MCAEALQAILDGRMAEAYGLIDEAMLPVLADQVPIDWAGDIYCVVLNQCHRLADLPRMRAWTASMERWCNDFAASATYGGVCDVHRLQVKANTDDYRVLEDRLIAASRALEDVNGWAAGEGYYQLGEVRRRRGDSDGALAAFSRARALGIEPQPGEALLRCQTGDSETAWTDLRVALAVRGPARPDAAAAWRRRGRADARRARRGRTALRRTGIRRRGIRHAGISRMGGPCPRRGPGAPGAACRGSRAPAVGAAGVPDAAVAVRHRPGLRMDGDRPPGARGRRRGRRRRRHRGEHLPPTRRRARPGRRPALRPAA